MRKKQKTFAITFILFYSNYTLVSARIVCWESLQ